MLLLFHTLERTPPGSLKNWTVAVDCERTRVTHGISAIITIIISNEEAYFGRYERNFKWPNYLYSPKLWSLVKTVVLCFGHSKRIG